VRKWSQWVGVENSRCLTAKERRNEKQYVEEGVKIRGEFGVCVLVCLYHTGFVLGRVRLEQTSVLVGGKTPVTFERD
jgi:hypothetical protein